jgi:NYN domain
MLGRVQSALFIDHENVGGLCPPERIANWVAWLEDGEFDQGHKRKFLEKRVYWNPSAQKHEKVFLAAGFKPILCEKFRKLKNGADIRIALDIAEMIAKSKRIKEFILFTKDTDFVPVLQRLRINERRTAVLVDENQEEVYGTYKHHADVVIPVRVFATAPAYERKERWARAKRALGGFMPARVQPAPARQDPLEEAEHHVIRVISLRPNEHTARRDIVRELAKIDGFVETGPRAYFGKGNYRALMEALAKRNDRIRVTRGSGSGISVRYVAKDEVE